MKQETKKMLVSLAMAGAMLSGAVSGCKPQQESEERPTNAVATQEIAGKQKPQRISLPSGAGVLCQDKQVILIPNIYENRDQYEKRLKEMNVSYKETDYTFITIIDANNKMVYDAAMMEIYPRIHQKEYNMLNNPVSSWASMQIGGGKFVARYTPGDILNAMRAVREQGRTLQ